ncbi:MAG: phosphoglycerate kinase [Planctomycetales bacterium 4484_113]|nr:MAG: phosphoglycerate kinase [Planctomycetales bacterium 4484_113]
MHLKRFTRGAVRDKRVLVRVDFNVPLANGEVTDDTRIRESLPTLIRLLDYGACPVLVSHLGRPGGKVDPRLTLAPVSGCLEQLLKKVEADLTRVEFVPDCIGEKVQEALRKWIPGEVILLENTRFYAEEEANDESFAREMAAPFDAFVSDAFGMAHRAHASNVGVTRFLPSYAGLLIEREVSALSRLLHSPERPFCVVLGGKKVSDKLPLLLGLRGRADLVLVGGAMMFTLARAAGFSVGKSLVEERLVEKCRELIEIYRRSSSALVMPTDVVVADDAASPTVVRNVRLSEIGAEDIGVDIGEEARWLFSEHIASAHTIFWNGPMGIFELKPFHLGTMAVAEAIAANNRAFSVVGGGESVQALAQLRLSERVSHVSTGGGASLAMVAGNDLPGLNALQVEAD